MKRITFLVTVIALGFALTSIGCATRIQTSPSVAEVPESPWILQGFEDDEGAELYAGCASCHMADGSGRSDGLVPRIAGQNKQILIHKLQKLREGNVHLPVMLPFARALSNDELTRVAEFISALPSPESGISNNNNYSTYCAGCHGDSAQGNEVLLAPGLCHQHDQYIHRRLSEIKHNSRGDADNGMIAVLNLVPQEIQDDIALWLSAGNCESSNEIMENNNG